MGIASVALATAFGTAACGDDDGSGGSGGTATTGSNSGGSTTTGTNTGGSTTSGMGGMGPECETPDPPNPMVSIEPGTVTATITDQSGAPAVDMLTDLCGTNICLVFGKTEADGSVNLPGMGPVDDPALLYGDGKDFAKFAAPITAAGSTDFGAINVLRLPAISSGTPVAEGENTSNEVTLTIEFGASIDIDVLTYENMAETTFRAVVQRLDGSVTLPAVDPALNLEVIVAMAPLDTLLCPGAALSFPNTEGWADGAEVEIFVHGTKLFKYYAEYRGWAKVAEAVVNGNRVETKDGETIELIGTYGARLKP